VRFAVSLHRRVHRVGSVRTPLYLSRMVCASLHKNTRSAQGSTMRSTEVRQVSCVCGLSVSVSTCRGWSWAGWRGICIREWANSPWENETNTRRVKRIYEIAYGCLWRRVNRAIVANTRKMKILIAHSSHVTRHVSTQAGRGTMDFWVSVSPPSAGGRRPLNT